MVDETRLRRISEADKSLLDNWREGVSIEDAAGMQIADLCLQVAAHRWNLGFLHRRDGNKLMLLPSPPYRSAISRYYYAMYHCFRAAAFLFHGGDDHEAHSVLMTKLPDDFPSVATWKNKLKNARLTRNRADYEPYPRANQSWKLRAQSLKVDADAAVAATRSYLRNKGCQIR